MKIVGYGHKVKIKPKKRDVIVDADHLIYFVAMANQHTKGSEFDELEGEDIETDFKQDLKPLKASFKALVEEYYESAEIEGVINGWKPGKVHLIFSDPDGNFRHELYPDYKSRPQEKPELFYRFRKWAHKKYGYPKNFEADDVAGYYARKGAIVFTTDKDVFKGCPGTFYNCHHAHRCWVYTTEGEAHHFNLLQTLAGDSTDTIPGIPGVGMKTRLLGDDHTWEKVVSIYKDRCLSEKDAILTRRLIGLDQWHPKKGLKLWEPGT